MVIACYTQSPEQSGISLGKPNIITEVKYYCGWGVNSIIEGQAAPNWNRNWEQLENSCLSHYNYSSRHLMGLSSEKLRHRRLLLMVHSLDEMAPSAQLGFCSWHRSHVLWSSLLIIWADVKQDENNWSILKTWCYLTPCPDNATFLTLRCIVNNLINWRKNFTHKSFFTL